jgi:hypothetical protein
LFFIARGLAADVMMKTRMRNGARQIMKSEEVPVWVSGRLKDMESG